MTKKAFLDRNDGGENILVVLEEADVGDHLVAREHISRRRNDISSIGQITLVPLRVIPQVVSGALDLQLVLDGPLFLAQGNVLDDK